MFYSNTLKIFLGCLVYCVTSKILAIWSIKNWTQSKVAMKQWVIARIHVDKNIKQDDCTEKVHAVWLFHYTDFDTLKMDTLFI